MENRNYKVEEVLMGFRGEYLKIKQELAELKKYTHCYDRRAKDYDFFLKKVGEYENPNLACRFDIKENAFRAFLEKFLLQFDWDIKKYGKDEADVLRDLNNCYHILGFYHAQVLDDIKFHEQVEKIIASGFAKYFLSQDLQYSNNDIIHLYGAWFRLSLEGIGDLSYYSEDDSLRLDTFTDNVALPEVLDYPLSVSDFNLYKKDAICKYRGSDKGIIVADWASSSRISEYKIEDEKNTTILRRVK